MYKIIEYKIPYPNTRIYLIWNSLTGVFPTNRFYTSKEEAEIEIGHLGPPEGCFIREELKK